MPRGKSAAPKNTGDAKNRLTLKTPTLQLEIFSQDSALIERLMNQLPIPRSAAAGKAAGSAATSAAPAAGKRKPGRPKGSKNLSAGAAAPVDGATAKKKPGRPKGSKNKSKGGIIAMASSAVSSIASALAPKRKGGRPKGSKNKVKSGAEAAGPAVSATPVSKAAIKNVMANAKASNNEQRVLLYGLAAKQSGGDGVFTVQSITADASSVGLNATTIPASLSKLKRAGQIAVSRKGRTAFYSLAKKGEDMAKSISEGAVIGGRGSGKRGKGKSAPAAAPAAGAAAPSAAPKRRGRPPGSGKKAAAAAPATPSAIPSAAPKRRGRPPGSGKKQQAAAAAAAATGAAPSAAPKRRGRPPGSGKKQLAAAAMTGAATAEGSSPAAAPKRRGRPPGSGKKAAAPASSEGSPAAQKAPKGPRGAAGLDKLSPEEQTLTKNLLDRKADGGQLESLSKAQDRALWTLATYGGDAPNGMSAKVISCLLKEAHGINAPANGVGAALAKAKPSLAVEEGGNYRITIDGRRHLEKQLEKRS